MTSVDRLASAPDYLYDLRDMDVRSSRAASRWVAATGEHVDGASTVSRIPLRAHAAGETPPGGRTLRLGARSGWRWLLLLVALGLVTLVLGTLSASVHSPSTYTLIGSAGSLISAFVAFTFVERMRSTHERRDLFVAIVFALLAAVDLLFAAASPSHAGAAETWHWLTAGIGLASGGAVLAAIAYRGGDERGAQLPVALRAGIVVFVCANAAALLSAGPYADRLYAPDALDLLADALMLYGCVVELRNLRAAIVRRASLGERRRIARDMHDGLAQELAFIAIYAQRLGRSEDDDATAAHLRAAAERALHESRTALAVLSLADDTPLDVLVTRTVDSFRSRFGVDADLDLEHDLVVDAEHRNALLRIIHEALTNAVRHGRAKRVRVELTAPAGGTHLSIADDGAGFDARSAFETGKGLGLTSMSERAEMLGGSVRISSHVGAGTVVEVELP